MILALQGMVGLGVLATALGGLAAPGPIGDAIGMAGAALGFALGAWFAHRRSHTASS